MNRAAKQFLAEAERRWRRAHAAGNEAEALRWADVWLRIALANPPPRRALTAPRRRR